MVICVVGLCLLLFTAVRMTSSRANPRVEVRGAPSPVAEISWASCTASPEVTGGYDARDAELTQIKCYVLIEPASVVTETADGGWHRIPGMIANDQRARRAATFSDPDRMWVGCSQEIGGFCLDAVDS